MLLGILAGQQSGPATAGLVQWLEADSGLNLATGAWVDKSGLGNSCTAKTGSPTLNASSLNGHPGITFDSTSFLSGTTNPLANGSAREVYFVVKPASAVTGLGLFASWHLSVPAWIADGRVTGVADSFIWDDGSGTSNTATGFRYAAATGYVLDYQSTVGSKIGFEINGIVQSVLGAPVTSDTGANGFQIGCYYGGTLGLVGDVCAVLVYSAIQSASDRSSTTAYLRTKYGL